LTIYTDLKKDFEARQVESPLSAIAIAVDPMDMDDPQPAYVADPGDVEDENEMIVAGRRDESTLLDIESAFRDCEVLAKIPEERKNIIEKLISCSLILLRLPRLTDNDKNTLHDICGAIEGQYRRVKGNRFIKSYRGLVNLKRVVGHL